jgi:hypothetical protein
MDWNSAAADWKYFECEVRSQWRRLSEGQLTLIGGGRARLAEQLRQSYGWTDEHVERQISSFELRNLTPRAVSAR